MEDQLIKVFEGTELSVLMLKGILENEGFSSIVKNNFRSGLMAGFGASRNGIELYIYKEDFELLKRFYALVEYANYHPSF